MPFGWPIVVHPDTIHDFGALARSLGALVAIENMDQRKPIGRTARELEGIFKQLPEARFCFDIGHARQIDATMGEASFLVQELGPRLAQLHVSAGRRHEPARSARPRHGRAISARWRRGCPSTSR